MRCVLRTEDVNYVYYLKNNYQASAEFGEFFIRTYGEEAFRTCMLQPSKVHDITGKTMDEIVADWVEDMRSPEQDEIDILKNVQT